MPKRLGGWQRLGVVLFVAWTLFIGVAAIAGWPAPDDPLEFWPDGTPLDGPPQLITEHVHDGQVRFARDMLVLWAAVPMILFVIGRSIRWVYRGFRPPAS